jgi:hypothetical protein
MDKKSRQLQSSMIADQWKIHVLVDAEKAGGGVVASLIIRPSNRDRKRIFCVAAIANFTHKITSSCARRPLLINIILAWDYKLIFK